MRQHESTYCPDAIQDLSSNERDSQEATKLRVRRTSHRETHTNPSNAELHHLNKIRQKKYQIGQAAHSSRP